MNPTLSRFALMVLLIALAACGGGDDDGPAPLVVEDMLGRSCEIQNAGDVRCDDEPMPAAGCPSGETACFSVGTTGDAAGPGAICAGCCKGNTSKSTQADCSNIVCSEDVDCPAQFGRCVSNVCRY